MQGESPPGSRRPPAFEALVADLSLLRTKGLGNLRRYAVPALHAACACTDLLSAPGSTEQEPAAIEALLRQAVEHLGGGRSGEAAGYTFGLVQGTKLWGATERRKAAAKAQGVSTERYRKGYEGLLTEQLAEGILAACHERRMREARLQLERRHPADSRLAVQWVERFEAYYRLWTPASQLKDNLLAAITTRREPDLGHAPWDESFTDYDKEDQAQGYGRYALYAYARLKLELRKFMLKHGGLWLLADAETEQAVADAVYRIGWHNPLNEDDDSWLRRILGDSRYEESEHFHHVVRASRNGQGLLCEWQEYVASCQCLEEEPAVDCQVHSTIQACADYLRIIDEEWLRIADWYHPGQKPIPGVDGAQLYGRLIATEEQPRRTET